jgi:hypothetical protein
LLRDKAGEAVSTLYLGYNIIGGFLRENSLRGKDLLVVLHTLATLALEVASPGEYLAFVGEN